MSSVRDATYDVHALRYASRTCRKAEVFHRYEADRSMVEETLGLDYYFRKLAREERLNLVDGAEELFPGLSVTRLGGHTPGQLMVQVDSGVGEVVLASDAAHYYEELESTGRSASSPACRTWSGPTTPSAIWPPGRRPE